MWKFNEITLLYGGTSSKSHKTCDAERFEIRLFVKAYAADNPNCSLFYKMNRKFKLKIIIIGRSKGSIELTFL